MTGSKVAELLDRARGATGSAVEIDFGDTRPAWNELGRLISALNGFFAFNAGIQVFRVGDSGWGPELRQWNSPVTWKYTYAGLAEDLFCFGQDLLGTQFGLDSNASVVAFEPETGNRRVLGDSLEDWAGWLLEDEALNGAAALALGWQQANGALQPDERLIPRQFFVGGGTRVLTNLMAVDSAKAMRIRGPIAQQVHSLPPGTKVDLAVS